MRARVLFYNTFLLRAVRVPVLGRWAHEKPAVEARAGEIGAALAGAYDVAALCEVFQASERASVVEGWGGDPDRAVAGPTGSGLVQGSGLLTLSAHPVVRTANHVFRTRGSRWADVDAWADKGVLGVEVDLGLPGGNLEVYSTHLLYGGDLLDRRRREGPEPARLRQAQVEELFAFVAAVRRPENVAMVVGDLNVDAGGHGPDGDVDEGAEPAAQLQATAATHGFDDVWRSVGDGPGWTCDCWVVGPEAWPADPTAPDLCAEPAPERGDRHLVRIDYAFLQRPQPSHGISVEARAMRRRTFPRPEGAPDREVIATMSDHLGLHLDLEATSR